MHSKYHGKTEIVEIGQHKGFARQRNSIHGKGKRKYKTVTTQKVIRKNYENKYVTQEER